MKFEIGDKVSWCGEAGIVVKKMSKDSGVVCNFENAPKDSTIEFFEDGRYEFWHKQPSLVLIEKARKSKINKKHWQKCPVCDGVGTLYSIIGLSGSSSAVCPTCLGRRIIDEITGLPPLVTPKENGHEIL